MWRWSLAREAQLAEGHSAAIEVEAFTHLVVSWQGRLPQAQSRLVIGVAVQVDGVWSGSYPLVHWGTAEQLESPTDGLATVDIDTLIVRRPHTATAFRLSIEPYADAEVSEIAVETYQLQTYRPSEGQAAKSVLLPVPERSQRTEAPAIAHGGCSPTALAMVLAFYGIHLPTAVVAEAVCDPRHQIYGNWPLNTVQASILSGGRVRAWVRHFSNLEELELELYAGRPLVISHRWQAGDLDGAPIPHSSGHLIVTVGLTEHGDIIVNDPAANPVRNQRVQRVYRRQQLQRTWFERSSGIGYVFEVLSAKC